jgi:hypothetical protein
MGLELVGVAADMPTPTTFLGFPVQDIKIVAPEHYDYILVASLRLDAAVTARLGELGVPLERLILLPQPVESSLPQHPAHATGEPGPELPVLTDASA